MNDQESLHSYKLHIGFLKTGDVHLGSRWKTMGDIGEEYEYRSKRTPKLERT